jgi:hypothetical protein
MSRSFFHLPADEKNTLITRAADKLDFSELIIEKDLWVCWLLEKIFSLPIQMAFKGGTSLSKVFNLINRFSEDCDITIDYRYFNQTIDLVNISRSQLKKISDELKKQLQVYVSGVVLPHLQDHVISELPNDGFELQLSEDGEQLRFYYPSLANGQAGYLRDHVLIEFGIRNCTEPCAKHQITPYLEQGLNTNIDLPKPIINTLSPLRTFWEKVTLIHVECNRDRFVKSPDRLSRHWYDLYILNNSWVVTQALARDDILNSVIEYKKAFFNASYANYDDCLDGHCKLIPSIDNLANLKSDFLMMIDAGMFYQDPPSFDEMIMSLKKLESDINLKK